MAGDTEDLILSISADTKQIQRALQRLTGDTKATTTAIQQQFDELGNRTAGTFDSTAARARRSFTVIEGGAQSAGKKIEASMKASSFQTANLGSQLQDIAVQLQSGTSPLTIALQQGTQIQQVIGNAGAAGAVKALGGAFVSLINPVSLATVATIALIGYAVQYFSEVSSGGEKSQETLEKEAALIQKVADKWGEALPALKAYADQQAELANQQEQFAASQATIEGIYSELAKTVPGLTASYDDLANQLQLLGADPSAINSFREAFFKLSAGIGDQTAKAQDALAIQKVLSQLYTETGIPAAKALADVYSQQVVPALAKAATMSAKVREEQAALARQQDIYGDRNQGFFPTINLPDNAPAPDLRPSFEDVGQSLDSLNSAIDGFVNRVIKAESGGNTNAKNPNSSATGTGQFLESTWLGLFRKYYPQQAANLSRDAILDLRKNADISYDLIRKYAAENAKVLQNAGVTVNEAALQLAHFLGAGDAAKVLNAASGTPLQGLITQASINANPTILGGGRTVDDAIAYAQRRASATVSEGRTRAPAKTPDDVFKGSMEDIQRRIELLNAEAEAQAKLTPQVDDYGYAVDKARIKQQLLNDAAKAGVTVTPELAASIDELASNYAKASSSADQFKASQEKIAEQQQQINEFGRNILGGIIDDLRAGKDAGEIFANVLSKITDRLEDMLLNFLFPTSGGGGLLGGLLGGGGGGLLGGLLIPGILHSGGVAGVDGYGHGRAVSANTFAGAPRFHSGRLPGLRPDEIPAILKKGEPVLPSMGALNSLIRGGSSGASKVHVTVGVSADNNGNLLPFVESVSERKAGQVSTATISQYDKGFSARVGDVMERNG